MTGVQNTTGPLNDTTPSAIHHISKQTYLDNIYVQPDQ
jgi:hypothetical protein